MDLDIVFFGTSGSMPTAHRAPSALLVRRGGERLLFDCAEGTQRQMLRSSVGLVELREIFLTHFHADHFLGLPGMLKTFALRGRELPITIYGPPGLATSSATCGACSAGSPTLRARHAATGRRARAGRLPDRGLRSEPRPERRRLRARRGAAAGPVRPGRRERRSDPDRARSAARSSAASPSRSPTAE